MNYKISSRMYVTIVTLEIVALVICNVPSILGTLVISTAPSLILERASSLRVNCQRMRGVCLIIPYHFRFRLLYTAFYVC